MAPFVGLWGDASERTRFSSGILVNGAIYFIPRTGDLAGVHHLLALSAVAQKQPRSLSKKPDLNIEAIRGRGSLPWRRSTSPENYQYNPH